MANPSTELNTIRNRMNGLLRDLEAVDAIANLYNDLGGAAFFDAWVDDIGGPEDLTAAEFNTAMATMTLMQTWLDGNRDDLVKLRI
jgi:hypothetical protein